MFLSVSFLSTVELFEYENYNYIYGNTLKTLNCSVTKFL